MNQRISILGCGWLGLPLAVDLKNNGYEVYGSTTTHSKIKHLEENGIKPFIIDIGNLTTDFQDFLNTDVLIVAITSKNIQDYSNLIESIIVSKVQKVLFISSTSVYPFTNGIVTENTNTAKTPLAEIEQLFITNSRFKSTILRFGGLFGYSRNPGKFIKPNKPVDNPDGYINLIHRDDCIEIIKKIIAENVWNEVLNACADDHPKRREFYTKETKKVGMFEIVFNETSESKYKIIDSQKLKKLLDYEFIHTDLMKN